MYSFEEKLVQDLAVSNLEPLVSTLDPVKAKRDFCV